MKAVQVKMGDILRRLRNFPWGDQGRVKIVEE